MFFIPESILTGEKYIYNYYYNLWLTGNPHFVAKDKDTGKFKELGINDDIQILTKSPHNQSYKYINLKDINTYYIPKSKYLNRKKNHFFKYDNSLYRHNINVSIKPQLILLEKDGIEYITLVYVMCDGKLLPKMSSRDNKKNSLHSLLSKIKNKNKDIEDLIQMASYHNIFYLEKLKNNPNQLVIENSHYRFLLDTDMTKAKVDLTKDDIEYYWPEEFSFLEMVHSQELLPDNLKELVFGIDTYNPRIQYILSKEVGLKANKFLDFDLPQFTKPITEYGNLIINTPDNANFQFSNFLFAEISSWHTREGLNEIYQNMVSMFIKNNGRSLKTPKYSLPPYNRYIFFRVELDGNGYKLKAVVSPFHYKINYMVDAEFYYTPKNKDIKYNDSPNFIVDRNYQNYNIGLFADIQYNANNKFLTDNWQELKDEPESIKIQEQQEYLNFKNFKDIEIYEHFNNYYSGGKIGNENVENLLKVAYDNILKSQYKTDKLIDSRFDFFNDVLNGTHIYIVDTNICRAIGFEKDYWRFMPLQALWFEVNDLYLYTQDGSIDKFNPKYIDENGNFIYDLYLFDKFKFKWYMKCKEVLWDTKLQSKQDFKFIDGSNTIKVKYCESKRDMYQTIYELFKISVIRLDNIRLDLEIK